jgi:hypothetical protein
LSSIVPLFLWPPKKPVKIAVDAPETAQTETRTK